MWQLTFLEFPTIVLVKQVTRPKDLKSFAKSFLDFILTSLLVRYQGIYDGQNYYIERLQQKQEIFFKLDEQPILVHYYST